MAAQPGNAVVLLCGPQGSQQAGASVVLEYSPTSASTRVCAGIKAPWLAASTLRDTRAVRHSPAVDQNARTEATWPVGIVLESHDRASWGVAEHVDDGSSALWGKFERTLQPQPRAPWGVAAPKDLRDHSPWGRYERRVQPQPRARWGVAIALDDRATSAWLGPMRAVQPQHQARFERSAAVDARRWLPWTRYSRELAPGWGVVTPGHPGPVPEALFYILPARFYMTVHSITAERLSDLAEIPIYDVTLGADAGSFAWSFSANGPASVFDLLAPTAGLPTQLRITVDGLEWVFVVETVRRNREFGKAAVSIGGRSATALIGAPWQRVNARTNTEARTAQQLAADALALSGVGLDWGLTDWLVPAGAWSHQGTALAAVQAIAEAAGGYVLSHRSDATLLVRHPYPVAPWDWGAGVADVELAPDAILTSAIERRDGPDINAVYVSGTSQGVLAWVKRAGTAGDKLAAMVADPLNTHVDASRQRGLAVLGAAGAKQHVTLDLPVLTGPSEPGVLDVGQLVQINEAAPWRGRVRAITLRGARPVVRQSVTLERHL
jgi:hypothetical protein